MDISKIKIGKNPPSEVNVVIEVPMNADPIKYEFDKESGAIVVDRIIGTPMYYPCNYGFIPNTLSDDGDPCDVLVINQYSLIPGSVIAVRPIGVLLMEDESGMDEKIVAVPAVKINPFYKNVNELKDLPESLLNQIKHFFEHYKDLEAGKWVKLKDFADKKKAEELILESIKRAEK